MGRIVPIKSVHREEVRANENRQQRTRAWIGQLLGAYGLPLCRPCYGTSSEVDDGRREKAPQFSPSVNTCCRVLKRRTRSPGNPSHWKLSRLTQSVTSFSTTEVASEVSQVKNVYPTYYLIFAIPHTHCPSFLIDAHFRLEREKGLFASTTREFIEGTTQRPVLYLVITFYFLRGSSVGSIFSRTVSKLTHLIPNLRFSFSQLRWYRVYICIHCTYMLLLNHFAWRPFRLLCVIWDCWMYSLRKGTAGCHPRKLTMFWSRWILIFSRKEQTSRCANKLLNTFFSFKWNSSERLKLIA